MTMAAHVKDKNWLCKLTELYFDERETKKSVIIFSVEVLLAV